MGKRQKHWQWLSLFIAASTLAIPFLSETPLPHSHALRINGSFCHLSEIRRKHWHIIRLIPTHSIQFLSMFRALRSHPLPLSVPTPYLASRGTRHIEGPWPCAVNDNSMVNVSNLENRKQSGLSVSMLYLVTYSREDTDLFAHIMGNSRTMPGRCGLEPRDKTKLFYFPVHCSILSFQLCFHAGFLDDQKGTLQAIHSFLCNGYLAKKCLCSRRTKRGVLMGLHPEHYLHFWVKGWGQSHSKYI